MSKNPGQSPLRFSIFSAFYPFRGGIAQFNARLYRELQKVSAPKAFTFTKQYPDFLFPGKTQLVKDGDVADEIPAERVVNPFNPFSWFLAVTRIRKCDPDVFVTNFWMTFFAPCFGFLANWQRRSTITIGLIHNLIPHEPRFYDRFMAKFYLKRHDGFIVLSEAVERELLLLRPNARYVRLFHPWYDHFGMAIQQFEARRQLRIDENKITLLFFGLVRDYKGLDILIEAFSYLPDNYQLVIAGEVYGGDEGYKKRIAESAAGDRIIFHNRYIADNAVPVYFSAADLCVLPYRSATQSGITAVSFHFEVPVVVTDVGDLRRTVESVSGGVVVDRCDASLMAKGILKAADPVFRNECVEKIRQAKNKFSWEIFAEKLLEFASSLKQSD
ncbi:MAG: glycosyltransferase [Bacteroidota bacterium]|jgi:glycosyltransferase involved in cell wall biosynthesis